MATAKYSRNSRGYFSTRVWDGTYNADGSKHRVNLMSRKSSRDLENKVNEFTNRVMLGINRPACSYTFQEYARHWLEVKKGVRELNTRAMYENVIEKHFSFLSDVPLSDIRHSHFDQAIANCSDKPRTCQVIYITFRQIMRMAVSDHFITKDEFEQICDDVSLPHYVRTEKRALYDVEKDALKACFSSGAFTARERAFLTLIYYCGMRKGEVLALSRFDFKFAPGSSTVSINKVVVFDKNNPEIKSYPKTDHGLRIVPLPDPAALFLQGYVESLNGSNLFPCGTAALITKSSYDKMWKSILRKLNAAAGGSDTFPVIRDLTAHIFRHNYCSQLCYKVPEISIKKIAQLMGDTIPVIMNVYDHIIDEKENVADAVTDALAM